MSGQYSSTVPVQWQGRTYYFPAQREVGFATPLARSLMPPPEPEEPKYEAESTQKYLPFTWKLIVIVLVLPLCGLSYAVTLGVLGVLGLGWNGQIASILGLVIWVLLFFVLLILSFRVLSLFPPTDRLLSKSDAIVLSAQEKAQRIPRERYSNQVKEYENWQRAIARWNELYYCARDDGVFLISSRFVPRAKMIELLSE